MLTVRVKKSKWYRGKGCLGSMLRRTDGQMCCIGFLARELFKIPEKAITNVVCLEQLTPEYPATNKFYNKLNLAYTCNDDEQIDDTERMNKLRKIGKSFGVKFVFQA